MICKDDMNYIVLSGINLHAGGTLTIYRDLIKELIDLKLNEKYKIVCFVYKRNLFQEFCLIDNIEIVEIPASRNSYFIRLYYEYIYFFKYSSNKNVHVWISVQDITPRVKTKYLYTYCHNPMMFYKFKWSEIKYSKKLFIFSLLYKYVYRFNIKKNTFVIVQQNWIRDKFVNEFKINNILVASPRKKINEIQNIKRESNEYLFVFASQATFFKNFEVICEAVKILNKQGVQDFKVALTIDGTEGVYSAGLRKKYDFLHQIEWKGFLSQKNLFELYGESDCMIFPSRLETWGLPISEYENTGKPIIVSDLPYAHETVGNYSKVAFFDPNDPFELAKIMNAAILKQEFYGEAQYTSKNNIVIDNWKEFWQFVILPKV